MNWQEAIGKAPSAVQQSMADQVRRQWETYQVQMKQYNPYADINKPPPPPQPTSITIPLADFQRMPVQSGEELLTALTVMMRMEGVDVESAEKVTIEIEKDGVKVSAKQPVRFGPSHLYGYKSVAPTAMGISGMQNFADIASQQLAAKIDAECMEILKRGGAPEVIKHLNPTTMDYTFSVIDKNKA